MDHDELMEQATRELGEVLERIQAQGTCPVCLAALLLMVAEGILQNSPSIQNTASPISPKPSPM